jgi:hypothetical protein
MKIKIHRTVSLFVVLYECEAYSRTLREEHEAAGVREYGTEEDSLV